MCHTQKPTTAVNHTVSNCYRAAQVVIALATQQTSVLGFFFTHFTQFKLISGLSYLIIGMYVSPWLHFCICIQVYWLGWKYVN